MVPQVSICFIAPLTKPRADHENHQSRFPCARAQVTRIGCTRNGTAIIGQVEETDWRNDRTCWS
jgi:hypothetical protein